MRTSKLGLMSEVQKLLMSDESCVDVLNNVQAKLVPRRRGRLKTSGVEVVPDAIVEFATQSNRFAGLDEKWFWSDMFHVPERPIAWVDENAKTVFLRRQESKLSLGALAREFDVSRPTIKAAIRSYEESHSGIKDQVKLQCGGTRPKKFDLSIIGPKARQSWEQGTSKGALARQHGCSIPTIDKALTWAYNQDGLSLPNREEHNLLSVNQVRQMRVDGKTLTEISHCLQISVSTVRKYLRQSLPAHESKTVTTSLVV